jgi:hypothetical protein
VLENFKQKRERLRHGFEDNIKVYFWCIICEVVGWIELTTDKLNFRAFVDKATNLRMLQIRQVYSLPTDGCKWLQTYTFMELYRKRPASAFSCFERAFTLSFVKLLVDTLNPQFNAFDCWM